MATSGGVQIQRPDSVIRRFLQHHGSTIVGQGLILGLGTLTGILSARLLGPMGRGEYAAITLWPLAISSIIGLGINQAVGFNVARRNFTVSEVATAASAIGIVQGAAALAIGLVVIHFVLGKYSHHVMHLGVVFVLFMPLYILGGYPSNLFQGAQRLTEFNLIRVTGGLTFLIGLAALFVSHRGSLGAVLYSQLAGYVAALVLGVILVWRILKPGAHWNRQAVPSLVRFGYRTQVTSLTNYFNQRIDQLFLSLLVAPQELGLYVVAVTLSTTVTVFPQAAGIVTFSRGSSQRSDDARVTIGESFRASLLWLLVACTALYLLAPFLIRHVFGAAFEGSILACRILLPGALMIGLKQVLYNGSSALGRPGLPSIAEGASVAVTAVGLYLLVPRYGYIGAAIISTVAYTISLLVMLWLARRLLGLSLRGLFMARPAGAAAVFSPPSRKQTTISPPDGPPFAT